MIVNLTVNGEARSAKVDGWESLLFLLREGLGFYGTKDACGQGECGACTVILDGRLVCSCLVMGADAEGAQVATVEGVAGADALTAVQQAMLETGAVQCGFCTPGLVMAATELFRENPKPSRDEIREALSGNVCRCTGYGAILRAMERVAGREAP